MSFPVNDKVDAFVLTQMRSNPKITAAQLSDSFAQLTKLRETPARLKIRRSIERLQRRGKIRYEPGWVVEEGVL